MIKGNYYKETDEIYFEENNSPSLTVVDQVISIKEMLNRHLNGIQATGTNFYYDEEESDFFPEDYKDLTELDELAVKYSNDKKELEDRVKTERTAFQKKIIEQNEKKELEQYERLRSKFTKDKEVTL